MLLQFHEMLILLLTSDKTCPHLSHLTNKIHYQKMFFLKVCHLSHFPHNIFRMISMLDALLNFQAWTLMFQISAVCTSATCAGPPALTWGSWLCPGAVTSVRGRGRRGSWWGSGAARPPGASTACLRSGCWTVSSIIRSCPSLTTPCRPWPSRWKLMNRQSSINRAVVFGK